MIVRLNASALDAFQSMSQTFFDRPQADWQADTLYVAYFDTAVLNAALTSSSSS